MSLLDFLDSRGIKYTENVDTSRISSIKAGGKAKLAVYPKSSFELFDTIACLRSEGLKYKLVGKCTNMYFADEGYEGALISTAELNCISFGKGEACCECGASLIGVIRRGLERGLNIAAELSGIPGSIGGAVTMNAGAFGASIQDVLIGADVYDPERGRILYLSNNELSFSYRSSAVQGTELCVISARIHTENAPRDEILEKINTFSKRRRETQPSQPSLGSFFKSLGDVSASRLIDGAGLKGYSIGGASVSEKHAGFVINNGTATAGDITALAEKIEETVLKKYSRRLEREAELCR